MSWDKYYCELDEVQAEDLECYCDGGYYPVNIGDFILNETKAKSYRVVHKLGYGGCATVWLGRDVMTARLIALKILNADDSDTMSPKALPELDNLINHYPQWFVKEEDRFFA